jgi:hypothetical protein
MNEDIKELLQDFMYYHINYFLKSKKVNSSTIDNVLYGLFTYLYECGIEDDNQIYDQLLELFNPEVILKMNNSSLSYNILGEKLLEFILQDEKSKTKKYKPFK